MKIPYKEFMKTKNQTEKIQSAFLLDLSNMGYDPSDDIKKSLYNIAEQLVNEKSKVMGFRDMSLAQLCEAYDRAI